MLTGLAPPRRPLGADTYERIACADGPRSYYFRGRQEDVLTEHLVLPVVPAGGLDAAAASGTIEAEDDGLAPHSSPGCRLTRLDWWYCYGWDGAGVPGGRPSAEAARTTR